MNTRDIPVVILGVAILYIAYLLQNNLLHRGFEGFQDSPAPGAMPPEAMPPGATPPGVMFSGSVKPAMIPPENAAQIMKGIETIKGAIDMESIAKQLIETSQQQPPPREGFQSYQNPYNTVSPNIQQSYEFKLGRRSLVDEVIGVMNT
jgi:hypothetical protein